MSSTWERPGVHFEALICIWPFGWWKPLYWLEVFGFSNFFIMSIDTLFWTPGLCQIGDASFSFYLFYTCFDRIGLRSMVFSLSSVVNTDFSTFPISIFLKCFFVLVFKFLIVLYKSSHNLSNWNKCPFLLECDLLRKEGLWTKFNQCIYFLVIP